MLIGNLLILQTLILLAILLGGFFLYKRNRGALKPQKVVEIEQLPNNINVGFGYLKGDKILLKKDGIPYLFETYPEALNYFKQAKGATKVVYQKWDPATQMVFIGSIQNGPEKR